ncbi:MAG: DUF58 domain-containing protein [Verrucomicrobiae bacterium]|nr:DUF58 domain-containing protein [Verrucomicrobiae bacterium]
MSSGIARFLTPQQRQRLGRLMLQSRSVVEGTLAGRHRSPLRGISHEFAEHRAYIPGDDPKHLDWKVLARTDRYYIRRYEDETNLRVYLIVDRSASMGYSSHSQTKFDYACHLAAALGYVVVKARDAVGLYLYADELDEVISARNSFAHLNNLLKRLETARPAATTHTARALHRVANDVHRRALIVVISDLLDEQDDVIKAFAHFRKQHHDVIVFQVLDPAEREFPFKSGIEFVDLETGETVLTDARALAAEYRRVFEEFLQRYRQACTELKVDYRVADTRQPLDLFVREYLERRKKYTA